MNCDVRSELKRTFNKNLADGEIQRAAAALRQLLSTSNDAAECSLFGKRIESATAGGRLLCSGQPRILLLGQSTTTWLKWSLLAQLYAQGIFAQVDEGEYDNVVQELQGRDISAYQYIVLLPSSTAVYNSVDVSATGEVLKCFWEQVWATIRSRSQATIIQIGYDYNRIGPMGLQLSARVGPLRMIRKLNEFIQDSLQCSDFYVDVEYLAGVVGRRTMYDERRYFWTKQLFSEVGINCVAQYLSIAIKTMVRGAHKVLALDLDNTLWGGIVGEEGPQGIELGISPQGEAFISLQKYVKQLRERGIVLSVATKNNFDDAVAPFRENTQMVLREGDISSFKANWGPKPHSLQETAHELNLGLESVVFMDDNPVERELVASTLTEVSVVPLGDEPSDFVRLLEEGFYFESLQITDADKERVSSYEAEQKRTRLQGSFGSLDDFLSSLELQGFVEGVHQSNLSRVVQLISKTNQFNLTTSRLTSAQVESIAQQGVTVCMYIKDKFGDYGLVGVALAAPRTTDGTYEIPVFLMSCRVIGRTAEHFMFNRLLGELRARGVQRVETAFIPSSKNAQVANLCEQFGFSVSAIDGGSKYYSLDVESASIVPSFIKEVSQY